MKIRKKPAVITAVVTGIIFMLSPVFLTAQEMPPRPVGVSFLQSLNFGAFSLGPTGGTVTITPYGVRSSTGDIILVTLGYLYYPAIFTLEGNPGTIIHFLSGGSSVLTGSNGGTLLLDIGECDLGDPIIINVAPPGQMQVRVGGTLHVGSPPVNPPGSYTGTFMIMFIQE